MENLIKNIIEQAKELKNNPEVTDYDIAQFVHIELGKAIYYDNNYTAKLNNVKEETELSRTRKSNMLKSNIDKSSKAQICKGMSEIYADILNELGIEAKSIGIEKKGETQELSEDEAKKILYAPAMEKKETIDYLVKETGWTRKEAMDAIGVSTYED